MRPSAGEVTVRVARGHEEIAAAGALTAEAYHADRLIDDGDEYLDELRDAERRSREATLLVAVVEGADEGAGVVVGSITLAPYGTSYAEVATPGEVEVRMLAVAPEARRRGVAEALMRAAARETVLLGSRALVLSTLDAMATAHRLYARLGFRRVPERDWHHEEVALRVYTWRVPEAPGAVVECSTWRPVQAVEVDGWSVGVSRAFTRRANSAVPPGGLETADRTSLDSTLAAVEAIYQDAGQASVVRVSPSPGTGRRPSPGGETGPGGAAGPGDLDAVLAERGYRLEVRTWVLVRTVHDESTPEELPPGTVITVADEPDERWLDAWLDVKSSLADASIREVARAVVTGSPAAYLTAADADGPVGVIRVALADTWAGLSCLSVVPRARRRGVARSLTGAALVEALHRGAERAFLQVEDENAAAIALYTTLGFEPAELYHYRGR